MQASLLINKFGTYLSEATSLSNNSDSSSHPGLSIGSSLNRKKFRRFFRNSTYFPFIIVGIVLLILFAVAWNNISNGTSVSQSINPSADTRVDIGKPKSKQVLNKLFLFPLKDKTGKEVSKLKFTIESAELRNEVIVKGQRARAVKGRQFLILNLKIVNDFDQTLEIKARDYVRLIINNSNEKLAPEIHNDPVEVQAISTKYTRIGFPIDEVDKNLLLQVGEVKGEKVSIKLNLN